MAGLAPLFDLATALRVEALAQGCASALDRAAARPDDACAVLCAAAAAQAHNSTPCSVSPLGPAALPMEAPAVASAHAPAARSAALDWARLKSTAFAVLSANFSEITSPLVITGLM